MRVIIPPIKSQGIKTKLVPWIQALVPAVRGRWIEPFLGTGVVAFNSGFREALLSDINPHVIRFYKGVKNHEITPGVCANISKAKANNSKRLPKRDMRIFVPSEIVSTNPMIPWISFSSHERVSTG